MRQCAPARSPLLPALRECCAPGDGTGCCPHASVTHPAPSTPPWTPIPPVPIPPASVPPQSSMPPTSMPVGYSTVNLPPAAPQPQRRSPLFKLLAIALVLILVAGLTILAGILYVGYRVGQKATHAVRTLSQATTSPAERCRVCWPTMRLVTIFPRSLRVPL